MPVLDVKQRRAVQVAQGIQGQCRAGNHDKPILIQQGTVKAYFSGFTITYGYVDGTLR
ncbi:hypothetical protein D3C75_1031430 [compost metagenome]